MNKIPDEIAKIYWNAFLKRTEKMTYTEAETELPHLIGVFSEVYPERCPAQTVEENLAFQPQLKAEKTVKKRVKEIYQPTLFD